jgi:hypothetical protein
MQIISIVAPIVTFLVDLIFIKHEILVGERLLPGNPIGLEILAVAAICLIISIFSLYKKQNKVLGIVGIVLNILLLALIY